MARRRDDRRFGRGPFLLGLRRDDERRRDGFPFDVPAVAAVETLSLEAPITLLAGVLDEPEAALSVTGELALLAAMTRAAHAGAQFVVATHSPILLACPDASIYELDDDGIAPCGYDDLETVRLTGSGSRSAARGSR